MYQHLYIKVVKGASWRSQGWALGTAVSKDLCRYCMQKHCPPCLAMTHYIQLLKDPVLCGTGRASQMLRKFPGRRRERLMSQHHTDDSKNSSSEFRMLFCIRASKKFKLLSPLLCIGCRVCRVDPILFLVGSSSTCTMGCKLDPFQCWIL